MDRSGDGDDASRGFREFRREPGAFDGLSYLWQHEDLRFELGFDPEGAYRHWWFAGHAQDRYPPGLARARPRRCDSARFRARPFGFNVFGPFDAVSGLGTAARNLVEAIRAAAIPHVLHPFDVGGGAAQVTVTERDRSPRYRVNLLLANADQIRHVAAQYAPDTFDDAWTIAVWAWELAAFRPEWHGAAALVDEVWTNSRFELAALAGAMLPVPVHLMPLPVPAPDWTAAERSRGRRLFGIAPDAWAVLCPFDAGSTVARKNPFGAIEAFGAAFGDDPDAVLLLKYHGGDAGLRRALEHARGGAPNIRVIGARLPAGDMRLLQAAADALLSPHRAEGFGLNIAEMLAGGRAAIATDWSGSRDFLDDETGFPVRYRLVPVGERTGPYLADAVWAEPDASHLVEQLRAAREDDGARAARAARRLAREFAPGLVGARMRRRLEALGLDRADEAPLAVRERRGEPRPVRRPARGARNVRPARDALNVRPVRDARIGQLVASARRRRPALAVAAAVVLGAGGCRRGRPGGAARRARGRALPVLGSPAPPPCTLAAGDRSGGADGVARR